MLKKATASTAEDFPDEKANPKPEIKEVSQVFKVQVMSVRNMAEARQKLQKLEGLGGIGQEQITVNGKDYTRIMLGVYKDSDAATTALSKAKSLGFSDAFIVKYEEGKRVAGI